MAGEFVIGNMIAKLAADTSDFITDMSGAGNVAKDFKKSAGAVDEGAKTIKGSFANIKSVVQDFIVGGGILLAGRQLVGFVKDLVNSTVDYGLAVDTLANITQTSYEETSKLIQIADDARISQDTLKMAMKEMVDGGIQPTIENLADLADEYAAISDPVKKANFLMETFGKRAGVEMGRMMEMGAKGIKEAADEAERLNLVLGEDGVEAAKNYYAQMDNLQDAWQGFKIGMGESVLPGIADFLQGMNDMTRVMEEGGIPAWWDWWKAQNAFAEQLAQNGITLEGYHKIVRDGIELGKIKAAQYDQETGKLGEVADATEDVAGANKDAEQATKDWLAEMDTGLDRTIENWLGQLRWLASGGGDIQRAAEAVHQALLEHKITPAEAESYFNEIYVQIEATKVKLGEITAAEAAQNIADTLGVSLANAKQMIDDIKREAKFNIVSTITVKVKYLVSGGPGTGHNFGGINNANGMDTIVPQGYPNDSFFLPMNVTSGERVQVTPANEVKAGDSGGGGGDVYNEITIVNNDRLAAAQSMAMLQNARLVRLSGSMG